MENNKLAVSIDKINSDIKELKFRQAIGGDSWIVYRQSITFLAVADHYYRVDFVPTSFGSFVAKALIDLSLAGDRSLFPDPYINGRWWLTVTPYSGGSGSTDWTIFIFSTKKGTISITDLNEGTT